MRSASSGGYDDGIDEFLDSPNGQDYIKNYLEMLEDSFKNDFVYQTNMQEIDSYVAADNFDALDEFAEKAGIDGVSNGRELAVKSYEFAESCQGMHTIAHAWIIWWEFRFGSSYVSFGWAVTRRYSWFDCVPIVDRRAQ